MAELRRHPGVVLQNEAPAPPALLGEWLRERGVPHSTVPVWESGVPDDPREFGWVAALGAEDSVTQSEPAWVPAEVEFLRRAVDADVPVLGLCFGQALSVALGGGVSPAEPPSIGWFEIEDDRVLAERVRADLLTFFPGLRGRRIAGAWGGPVDVSPIHLPEVGTLPDGRIHYVHGFTGNGVGPAHLAGRILASLALDRRDELTRLALVEPAHAPVPPEPVRYLGGTLVRAALLRKEAREDAGLEADPLTELVVDLPRRLGIHMGR